MNGSHLHIQENVTEARSGANDFTGVTHRLSETNAHQRPRTHTKANGCAVCGAGISQTAKGHGRRRFCSPACRAKKWREGRRSC